MDRWLYQTIIVVMLIVWLGSFIARIVVDGYETPQSLDVIFGVVAGGAMALYREQLRRQWGKFTGDGRVNGYTGCNSLGGSYAIVGDILEVAAATTKRACAGAGGDYEKKLLEVLSDKPRIAVEGARRMTLTGAKGAKIEFVNAIATPVR